MRATMYLTMTQQDFEDVINKAPRIVAQRLPLSADQKQGNLRDEIRKVDPLAAGLLETFIETYTEWWKATCAATQGEPDSKESAKDIQRLIDKRGQMCSALISYLNSQYTEPIIERPTSLLSQADRLQKGSSSQDWKKSVLQTVIPTESDAGIGS